MITNDGVSADPVKLHTIAALQPPNSVSEFISSFSISSYVAEFVSNYVTHIKPLCHYTKIRPIIGHPSSKRI